MFIRKLDGTLVKLNTKIIHNDVDFYTKLWKMKYNMNIEEKIVCYFNTTEKLVSHDLSDDCGTIWWCLESTCK